MFFLYLIYIIDYFQCKIYTHQISHIESMLVNFRNLKIIRKLENGFQEQKIHVLLADINNHNVHCTLYLEFFQGRHSQLKRLSFYWINYVNVQCPYSTCTVFVPSCWCCTHNIQSATQKCSILIFTFTFVFCTRA